MIQDDLQEVDDRMEEEEVSLFCYHCISPSTVLSHLVLLSIYHTDFILTVWQIDAAETIQEYELLEQK